MVNKMVEMSPEQLKELIQGIAKTIAEAKKEESPWKMADIPIEVESKEIRMDYDQLISNPGEITTAKELRGFKTHSLLDELFLDPDGNSLDGLPEAGQFGITGGAGSGKSILIEEIADAVAHSDKKVLLITTEDVFIAKSDRFDLQSRLMQKSKLLELDWEKIKKNLFVMDVINNPELRDWKKFISVYRYTIEKENIQLALIDSVTMLEDYRGSLKYRIMEISRFNQTKGVTGIYVNQRVKEEWDKYAIAGGMAVPHNLDGTILVDYGRPYYADQKRELGIFEKGTVAKMIKVMDCRFCNFNRNRIPIEITPNGFVRKIKIKEEKE